MKRVVHRISPSLALLASFAAALAAAGPISAASILTSSSTVENNGVFLSDNGSSASSLQVDANNYASSYIDSTHSRMGAVAANSQLGQTSTSYSEMTDDWFCPQCVFTSTANPMVDYTFHFDGWASASGNYMSLSATWSITTGSALSLAFFEDPGSGPDASVGFTATYTDQQHVTHNLPYSLMQDSSGNYRFSVDFTSRESLCGPAGCEPYDCVNNPNCHDRPLFSDDQIISLTVVGDGTPQILDASHTFQAGVASEDPNYQLASGLGPVSAAVPEPVPFLLTGLGLVALALTLRYQNFRYGLPSTSRSRYNAASRA